MCSSRKFERISIPGNAIRKEHSQNQQNPEAEVWTQHWAKHLWESAHISTQSFVKKC